MRYLFLFNFFINFFFIFCDFCNQSNFKQIISSCDLNTNLRNIIITKNSFCENKGNYNPENLISLYSTLPEYNISCDEKCNLGEIINFNPLINEIECLKCPRNTFNTGENFIISNWNIYILKKFKIKCILLKNNNEVKKYTNCFTISDDNSMIISNDFNHDYSKYNIQLMYFFNVKKPGIFSIKLKYDSMKINNNEINGEFKLYFDYKLISNNENNNKWELINHNFEEGSHQILILYSFNKLNNKEMKLYIKNIQISGLEDLKCHKCINSISNEGSFKCYSCSRNSYYNLTNNKCEECEKDKFSLPDSSSCINKQNCSNYDLNLINIGKCINNKKILKFNINDLCINNNNIILIQEINCNENEDLKFNYFDFTFNFNNYLLIDFFDVVYGFFSNGKEIYSGLYNGITESILIKEFYHIPSFTNIEIDLELNLENDENFIIKINDEEKKYNLISKNLTEKFLFKNDYVKLSFIYIKNSSSIKIKNGVIIKKIHIYDSQNDEEIIECPSYTFKLYNTCYLNDVLFQAKEKLKYNLLPFKNYIKTLCDNYNNLCYQNSFILLNKSNDLFFISLFQQNKINLSKHFNYIEDNDFIEQGFIFALFQDYYSTNSEKNISKIKKNLGQKINKVYLTKNINSNIIIEIEKGDYCINNNNKRYKSYLILKCNKTEFSFPKLIKKLDECTFVFEWKSPSACKNCLIEDLQFIRKGECINNKREIFFKENDYCLIFDIKNINFTIENDDILNSNSDLYKQLFNEEKENIIINESNNTFENFDFEYVNNKSLYESCKKKNEIIKTYFIIIVLLNIVTLIILIYLFYKYKKKANKLKILNEMYHTIENGDF